jgi:methyl-accepting chemotaxis protein
MIKDQARIGSNVLVALVAVAIALSAFLVMEVRYGGPIFKKYALQDELLADILPPPAYVVEPYLEASLLLSSPEKLAGKTAALAQLRKDYEARKAYWQTTALPADQLAVLRASQTSADGFWLSVERHYLPAVGRGDMAEAKRVHDAELAPAYEDQHQAILKLVDMSNSFRAKEHASDDVMVNISLVGVGLLMLSVVVAIMVARRLVDGRVLTPLGQTAQAMERMAGGDYHSDVEGRERADEIGVMAQAMEVFRQAGLARAQAQREQQQAVSALTTGLAKLAAQDLEYRIEEAFPAAYEVLRQDYNRAQDALMQAIGTVRVGAGSLMSSISEIRAASEDLARRNEQQAASLEETAASMNEVAHTVQASARTAATVRNSTLMAQRQASEGGQVVTRAVDAMAAIEASSQEIGQIINVIDGIAFQTNLLALNAGVEAARAGDAGRGFAVVANEVRLLAQRSADAARDIKGLISNSSVQVAAGVALVGETGSKLREIEAQVSEISGLIEDIATSSERQASNIQLVNSAVGEMDRMTQQNAAMVEQSSAATRSLADEATRLAQLVATFRTRNRKARPEHLVDPVPFRRQGAAGSTRREVAAVKAAPLPVVGNLAVAQESWSEF